MAVIERLSRKVKGDQSGFSKTKIANLDKNLDRILQIGNKFYKRNKFACSRQQHKRRGCMKCRDQKMQTDPNKMGNTYQSGTCRKHAGYDLFLKVSLDQQKKRVATRYLFSTKYT